MSSYRPLSHDEDRPLPRRDDDAVTVASSSSSLSARDPVYPTAPLARLPTIGGNDRASSGLDGFEDVLAMVQGMSVDAERRSAPQQQHDGANDHRQSYGDVRAIPADNSSIRSRDSAAPPNIRGPRDRNFDYSSVDDVHSAIRYTEAALPPPISPPPAPEQRPASGDLFEDFDGVHCSPVDEQDRATPSPQPVHHRSRSSTQLHHPRPQTATPAPSSHRGQAYYPAPVPAVLNLPPLLSKPKPGRSVPYTGPGTAGIRSQTPELLTNRRSIAHVRGDSKNLPAALRASAFFDNRAPTTVIAPAVKESSAMATLDSILDASAMAPPAAFTDHPITGTTATTHIPVHGHNSRHSVHSLTVKHHPGESPTSSDRSSSPEPEPEPTPAALDPNALPTTLLAELESRKAQQKSRNRNAATSGGIRSTLLELDAVAQVQAQTRRQKRTHLAWEDPEDVADDDGDEDIPLGVLFQQQPQHGQEDVPLGLLVKKELEDAEPLAKRAARLKREQRRYTLNVDIPSPAVEPTTSDHDDEEGETLAQRRARLRAPKAEEEETLAQRRARLKLREEAKLVQEEVRRRQRESVVGLGNASMASLNLAMNRGLYAQPPQPPPQAGVYAPQHQMFHAPPGAPGMYAAAPMVPPELAMNQQQRDFVERWRSSVM